MHTEVTIYINDIEIPIAPVNFEYGVSSGEMTQIATISPKLAPKGSLNSITYVYRDLGEKYIDLTFNIRTSDKSWKDTYGSNMGTDTDSIINPREGSDITNPQEFINWMIYAHGSGEPLKITIKKQTQYGEGKDFTHTLTGTYKVSRTSISSSADTLYHYATFSLGLVRYIPPVMEKVKMVSLGQDPTNISVLSNAVESYDAVQTTGKLRVSSTSGSSTSGASDEGSLARTELELIPMQCEVEDDKNNQDGTFKQLTKTTVVSALSTAGFDSGRILKDVFVENPMKLYNSTDPLAPFKGLGSGFLRVFRREANFILNSGRKGLIAAAGVINPYLGMGVEATFNIVGGLVSKIPLPSLPFTISEGLGASAETPLLGDGGIVLSYDTDLGFDPKLHATGFDPETISPMYRILEPGIYKRE